MEEFVPMGVQQLEKLLATDPHRLGDAVEVQAVAGFVLDLRQE